MAHCAGVEHSFSLNQCSTIAWSLGRCQLHHKSFWTQLSREFPVLFSDTIKAPSSIVVRLLWGMAAARFRHVRVLSEVVNWLDSGRRLRLCSPTELSRIIWSFSALNFSPGVLYLASQCTLLTTEQCCCSVAASWSECERASSARSCASASGSCFGL